MLKIQVSESKNSKYNEQVNGDFLVRPSSVTHVHCSFLPSTTSHVKRASDAIKLSIEPNRHSACSGPLRHDCEAHLTSFAGFVRGETCVFPFNVQLHFSVLRVWARHLNWASLATRFKASSDLHPSGFVSFSLSLSLSHESFDTKRH